MRTPLITALLAVALIAGCRDATAPSIAGTYALMSVNNFPLPIPGAFTEEDDEEICVGTIVSGSLVLTETTFDAGLLFSVECTEKESGLSVTSPMTLGSTGSYALVGSTITFDEGGGDTFTGLLAGNRITITIDDDGTQMVLRFER
jgi:hypothetical protein